MAWVLLIVSVFVLWIASLCKILHVSWFPSKVAYFNKGDSFHKKTSLLVIAHRDDESMFFTPSINYLTSRGHNVHILCLSTGNANGIGDTRKDELYKACSILKIPLKQVLILDHPELQDGFGKVWNHSLIAELVGDSIRSHGIDLFAFNVEDLIGAPSFPALYEIVNLDFRFNTALVDFATLLDGLLCNIHPRILQLNLPHLNLPQLNLPQVNLPHYTEDGFLKEWEEQVKERREASCCSDYKIKCWRHYLKW